MESKKACYMHAFLFLLLSPQGRELLRCSCVLDRYDGGCCPPQGRELLLEMVKVPKFSKKMLLSPTGAQVVTMKFKKDGKVYELRSPAGARVVTTTLTMMTQSVR